MKAKKKKNTQSGGLCLKSCNMDQGPAFHPVWAKQYGECRNFPVNPKDNTYTWLQDGGKSRRRKKSKIQSGGLCLKSCNMDQGAPFHPEWNKQYGDCRNFPVNPKDNTYTWLQDGGKSRRKNKGTIQSGGLCLKACNMDQGAPFHPEWNKQYGDCRNFPVNPKNNTYTWLQEGGIKKSKKKKQFGGLCLKSCNMDDGQPFHPIWEKNLGSCHNVPTAGLGYYDPKAPTQIAGVKRRKKK